VRKIKLGRTELVVSALGSGGIPMQRLSEVDLFHREMAKAGLD
jgi:hypothetical protein